MSLPDLMDFTTAQRPPSTPSKDSGFESDSPPPLLHSPASVKSLGSPRHGSLADLSHPRDDPRGQGLEYTPSKASTHALDGLASITTPTRKPMEIQLPELEPERPLSYPKSSNADDSTSPPTLSYIALESQKARNPLIKVLLVLSSNPAFIRELTTLDGVFRQFCADFSRSSDATAEATKKQQKMDKWTHISLYTHWRTHGADPIHGIHHYALQAKLEREDEVQWRLGLPVLEKLIEEEVRRGDDRRAFVVSGLKAGDLEGVRAFAERIAEPSGILLFSPEPISHTVPVEYWNRTARISPESLARATAAQRPSLFSSSAEAEDQTISEKDVDDDDGFVACVYRAVLAAVYAWALHD